MPITDAQVERYFYGLLPPRDAVLREIERQARRRHIPIVGPAVGRLLHQLAQLIGARRVFEMGSAIGYSTIWLARAVGPSGIVYYTDSDAANAREAIGYFRRAGVRNRIQVIVGEALEALDKTRGQFDLIFNDVDKESYPVVFRKAVPRLRRGGLLITDNVLWSGRVARPARDPATRAIQQFNRLLYRSRQLSTTILPLRDGLAVCQKL